MSDAEEAFQVADLQGGRAVEENGGRSSASRRCRSRPEVAVLLAALLFAGCKQPVHIHKTAASAPVPRPAPARSVTPRLLHLAPGVLDEVELKGGEERAYLLDLAAGQYAGLVVDQREIDVKVSLKSAAGKTVAAIDSFNGILGPEPVPFVAETGGRFRLEVASSPGVPGRYILRLEELRPATSRDRARV